VLEWFTGIPGSREANETNPKAVISSATALSGMAKEVPIEKHMQCIQQ